MSDFWEGFGQVCSVGDPVATGCGCQHRKCNISAPPACFQAGPSLRAVAKHKKSKWFAMEPIEGESGKRWAKMFPDICLSWAHRSAAELPTPKPHMICGPIFRMCRHVKVGVWGCVREMVCTVQTLHYVFPSFYFTHRTNSDLKGIIGTRKI